jgi:hypothetical protein
MHGALYCRSRFRNPFLRCHRRPFNVNWCCFPLQRRIDRWKFEIRQSSVIIYHPWCNWKPLLLYWKIPCVYIVVMIERREKTLKTVCLWEQEAVINANAYMQPPPDILTRINSIFTLPLKMSTPFSLICFVSCWTLIISGWLTRWRCTLFRCPHAGWDPSRPKFWYSLAQETLMDLWTSSLRLHKSERCTCTLLSTSSPLHQPFLSQTLLLYC